MSRQGLNRTAQWLLSLAFILVGSVLTFIVVVRFEGRYSENTLHLKKLKAVAVTTDLGEHSSLDGEALEEFLIRLGHVIHVFTTDTGNEACGVIGVHGTRYAVKLRTDNVPQGCVMRTQDVVEGYTFTGETIHSHPRQNLLVLSAAAMAWSQKYKDGNEGATTIRNDGASGFSRADYKNGAGWLVAKGKLMHYSAGRTKQYGKVAD